MRSASAAVFTTRRTRANADPRDGSEIELRVDDIQAEYDRALFSGRPIADPLQNRPWGMSDFRLFDPAGQYLRITNATDETRAEKVGRTRPDRTNEACSRRQGALEE